MSSLTAKKPCDCNCGCKDNLECKCDVNAAKYEKVTGTPFRGIPLC